MGNRLTKIYTRTGDDGSTGLGDGSRLAKDALRVDCYGTVDELNSSIGVLRAQLTAHMSSAAATALTEAPAWLSMAAAEPLPDIDAQLSLIQHELFDLGGELCIPDFSLLSANAVQRLEQEIDSMNQHLPALKNFVLPAGPLVTTYAHMARSICRRAERMMVTLQRQEANIPVTSMAYINRLSDWLFVLARTLSLMLAGTEVLWNRTESS